MTQLLNSMVWTTWPNLQMHPTSKVKQQKYELHGLDSEIGCGAVELWSCTLYICDVDQAAASLLKVESFKLELSPYRQIEPGMGTGHEITPPPPPSCQEITKITTPSNGKNEYWTQNEGFPSVKNDIITDQFSKMKLYSWMMWLVIMWHVVHILIFYLLLYDTELRAMSLHMMSSPAAATHNSELISITMCLLFLAPVYLFIMTTSEVLCVCAQAVIQLEALSRVRDE